jgi:ATP-binding cassette, subfamily B, multidrug efflux pump
MDTYEDEKFTQAEKDLSSREAFSALLPFLKNHRSGLTYCLILLAASTALSLWWPVLMQHAIDIDIAQDDIQGLLWTVILIGVIQGVTLVLQYIQTIWLETIGQDTMVELKQKLFDHVLSLDISYFDKNPIGRIMARIESDTEALRMLFTNTAVMLVGDVILVAGIFAIVAYYSWRLVLILLAFMPVVIVITYIYAKITNPRYVEIRKRTAEMTARLTEFLHGVSIIQIFHRADYASEKFNEANRRKFEYDAFVNIGAGFYFNMVFFLELVAIATVLYFGAVWTGSGAVTVGVIGMLIVLIWRAFEPIHRASEQLANIQRAIAGAKRLFSLLSEKSVLPDSETPVAWNGLRKSIRFENVWFTYDGDDNHVLKNVSFEIPAGKRVALAGVTGGGKSTIVSLLLRMYDPQQGRILVDDIDIRDIRKDELRHRFALVLQDIILFPGDIASNISLDSNSISDDKILRAAEIVEADRFIKRLPQGYKTEVSEKGANFSRGERQLLSFARALARDPDILILDEATSSVDPQTERMVQDSMNRLLAGRTSLIIAHRLSTILDVDEILVLRHGEIIERGTHVELLLADGYYSKLFHLQFKNGVTTNVG